MGKLRLKIRRRINWILYLVKRMKPYSVTQSYDDKGNYMYSVLCLHKRLLNDCNDFIRIKYDARKCEMQGRFGKGMEEEILRH